MVVAEILCVKHAEELTRIAKEFSNVVVLDADIVGGTGMHHFRSAFPKRFIQCGIAEQNMMPWLAD